MRTRTILACLAVFFAGAFPGVIDRRFAGTVAGTAPSTAHQVALNLLPDAPLGFAFEPPGYQLHLWRDGIGLVSHTAVLGDWPSPSAR